MSAEPTVFVVDDDPAVLDSLSKLLASQGLTTACFPSADHFLQAVGESSVGCLLVDLRMPGMTGIHLLQKLASDGASRPTVVITGYADIPAAVQAMKLGAVDLLQKPCHPAKLVEAVRTALESDIYTRQAQERRQHSLSRIEALSEDERILLSRIIRGLTNQQIADALDVSLRTVQFRRRRLFASLGVTTKSELFAIAEQASWFPDSDESV